MAAEQHFKLLDCDRKAILMLPSGAVHLWLCCYLHESDAQETTINGSFVSVVGRPDFLILDGDGYIIRDSKLSRRVNEDHHPEISLQLQLYGWLFERIVGTPVKRLQVHTGTGDVVDVANDGGVAALAKLAEALAVKQLTAEFYEPIGWSKCAGCGYADRCWSQAEDNHDVSLVMDVDQGLARELHANLLWADSRFVLVEPFAERRTGKLIQSLYAKHCFEVPKLEFLSNRNPSLSGIVAKSLSNETIDTKVLYTTRVDPNRLDVRYPWFLQQYVPALYDVTVVYVRGALFAFRLKRTFLEQSPDWRTQMSERQCWTHFDLPPDVTQAVRRFMDDLKLDFGRLDFLLDAERRYWFCEVNPNGQFAWLDLSGEYGLLEAIAQEISPATEISPIPNRHPLEPLSAR